MGDRRRFYPVVAATAATGAVHAFSSFKLLPSRLALGAGESVSYQHARPFCQQYFPYTNVVSPNASIVAGMARAAVTLAGGIFSDEPIWCALFLVVGLASLFMATAMASLDAKRP